MRRAVILLGLLLALLIAAARALTKPIFAPESIYEGLTVTLAQAQPYILMRIGLLMMIFVTLILASKRHEWPEEASLVIIATPALLIAAIQGGPALLIGALATAAALVWKDSIAIAAIAAAALLVGDGGAIAALLIAVTLLMRKRWLLSAAITIGSITVLAIGGIDLTLRVGASELGLLGGPSIFILLLAIIGLFAAWDKQRYPQILLTALAIIAGAFIQELSIVSAIAAAILAGYGINELRVRSWRLESVRNISLFFIILGLLFTATSSAAEAIRAPPDEGLIAAAKLLRATPDGAVLAPPERVHALRWYGVDATSDNWEELLERRTLEQAEPLLPRYIVLTEQDDASSLRFLIRHTDNFTILLRGSYSVWEVHE